MKNTGNFIQLDFGFSVQQIQKEPKKSAKKEKSDFVFDIMDSLTSPVIVYSSLWKSIVPADILSNITISRLLCARKGYQMASLTEVIAYLMPRTFDAPMPYEWVNIYTWCGYEYAKMFKSENSRFAMEEIAPKSLSEYEEGLLNKLRCWIYKKRREALKDRIKSKEPNKTTLLTKPVSKQANIFENITGDRYDF